MPARAPVSPCPCPSTHAASPRKTPCVRGVSTTGAEAQRDAVRAKREQPQEPRRDRERLHGTPDRTKRGRVPHAIDHPRALAIGFEDVLVRPRAERPALLVVEEPPLGLDSLDARAKARRPGTDRDASIDEVARLRALGHVPDEPKAGVAR